MGVVLVCHLARKSYEAYHVVIDDHPVWLEVLEGLCVSAGPQAVLELAVERLLERSLVVAAAAELVDGQLWCLLLIVVGSSVSECNNAGDFHVVVLVECLFGSLGVVDGHPACGESELGDLEGDALSDVAGVLEEVIALVGVEHHVGRGFDANAVVAYAVLELVVNIAEVDLELCVDIIYEHALFVFVILSDSDEHIVVDLFICIGSAGISLLDYILVILHDLTSYTASGITFRFLKILSFTTLLFNRQRT